MSGVKPIVPTELQELPLKIRREFETKYKSYNISYKTKSWKILLDSSRIYFIKMDADNIEKISPKENLELQCLVRQAKDGKTILRLKMCDDWVIKDDYFNKFSECETCCRYFSKKDMSKCSLCSMVTCSDCMSHYCDYYKTMLNVFPNYTATKMILPEDFIQEDENPK